MDVEGLSVVCAGLGVADEDETGAVVGYAKGQYCFDNLKDLQRFLRRDDPRSREVFQQVCRWNAAALHLVPMIEFCQAEQKLVVNAVKVLVFLTMPIDPASDNVCQQIEHLWSLKAAIARNETIAVIMSLLEDPLEDLERGAFTEDDWKLVQLVLTLFRNVLAIQEITPEQKASGFASQLICLRDKFLEVMFSENVMDLILILAQHINESCVYLHQDIFLILEIFYYILVNHDLELVASSSQKDDEGNEIGKMSLKSLESLIEEEEDKKRHNWLRNFDCSSQFQGTFTCLAVDGSKLMLKGTPTASCGKALLKAHKTPKGSIRRVAWDHENIYLPNQKILKLLCNFVKQFISGAYNVLMQSIQDEIERDHHAIETGDVNIFFKVAHFITAFQHHKFSVLKDTITLSELHNSPRSGSANTLFHGDICGPLAATMNEAMFLLVISQWRDAFEGLKQTNDYKSLSAAGSIMKDMIRMLALVLRLSPEDSTEPRTVRILLYKLFYDQTDQGFTQFLVTLIRSFDFKKQPKSDLADLVEILSTVLQLMEHLQTRGTLRVSKKSRNTRKKKHLSNVSVTGTESMKEPQPDTQLVDNECQKDLLNSVQIINGSKSECLDQNVRIDQKEETLPQNVDEEVQHLADNVEDTDLNEWENDNYTTGFINLAHEESGSSGDDYPIGRNEVDFNIAKFISNFANNSCIENICWLLKFYRSNSPSMNNHIVFILRQISEKLELSPIFYQVSILIIFYTIIEEQKFSAQKEHAGIVSFLTGVVRKLLRLLKNQPLLFVEILFWKTQRECRLMNADTMMHEISKLKKKTRNLGHVSDVGEDIHLSKEKEFVAGRSIADALGDDEAEIPFTYDLANQIDGVPQNNAPQNAYDRKWSIEFTSEEEALIKELYEKYKNYRNCSRLIAEALDINGNVSAVQVSAKLKKLGLNIERKGRKSWMKGPISGDMAQADIADGGSENLKHGCVETGTISSGKRVHVFSKQQEVMIRELFDKYKDHRRCNFMIAKEFHADNVYSASQISRKLKQLGLQVPHSKRTSNVKGCEQNEIEDSRRSERAFPERVQKRRRKNKLKGEKISEPNYNLRSLPEEFSDEDVLSSILLKSKHASQLSMDKTSMADIAETQKQLRLPGEEISDDETLGSILQKSREVLVKHVDKIIESSNQDVEPTAPIDILDDSMDPQVFKQDHQEASGRMEIELGKASGRREVELIEDGERLPEVDNDDNDDDGVLLHSLADEKLADELADSGDEGAHVIPKSFEKRRKIKMIDSDDE